MIFIGSNIFDTMKLISSSASWNTFHLQSGELPRKISTNVNINERKGIKQMLT